MKADLPETEWLTVQLIPRTLHVLFEIFLRSISKAFSLVLRNSMTLRKKGNWSFTEGYVIKRYPCSYSSITRKWPMVLISMYWSLWSAAVLKKGGIMRYTHATNI